MTVSTPNLPVAVSIDELLGNTLVDGLATTSRIAVDDLASQMVADGPLATEISDLRTGAASNVLFVSSWPTLAAITGTFARQGAQVIGSDEGSHVDPVVGGTVHNEGYYSWSISPAGWRRIGDRYMAPASTAEALAGTAVDKVITPANLAAVRTNLELVADVATSTRATATPWRWAVFDSSLRAVLGVARNGWVWARKMVFPVDAARASMRPLISVIEDGSGRPLLGADRRTGRVSLAIDQRRADLWTPPEQLRGAWHGLALRPAGGGGVVATIQDAEGVVTDVYQRRDILSDNVVAIESGGLRMTGFVGQSNAGAGSGAAGGPTFTAHAFGPWGLMLESGETSYGTTADSSSSYRPPYDLAAYAEPAGYGQAPAGMFLESHLRFERDAGRRPAPRVVHTSWEGSQPIGNFLPSVSGHYNHENLVLAIQRAAGFAAKYQRAFRLDAVVLIQGEAGPYPYTTAFGAWLDTVPALYAAAAGQSSAPALLWMQTNTSTSETSSSGVEMDQLAVARARTSPAFSLVGPMYQCPLHDVIHATDLGRMMLGEVIAVAHDRVVRQGLAWHPLWPVAGGVTRSGAVITIPMSLPPGTSALSIDTDWVQSVTNKGFVFSQTGGNSPVIQSVAISGTNVVVTLDVAPTGTSKKISYAVANDTGTTGWATGRGQIYAADTRKSWANRLGYAVPAYVRHYSVRFTESLS